MTTIIHISMSRHHTVLRQDNMITEVIPGHTWWHECDKSFNNRVRVEETSKNLPQRQEASEKSLKPQEASEKSLKPQEASAKSLEPREASANPTEFRESSGNPLKRTKRTLKEPIQFPGNRNLFTGNIYPGVDKETTLIYPGESDSRTRSEFPRNSAQITKSDPLINQHKSTVFLINLNH